MAILKNLITKSELDIYVGILQNKENISKKYATQIAIDSNNNYKINLIAEDGTILGTINLPK